MESKAPGIIYKPKESDDEEFYHLSEFEDLLTRALDDKLPDTSYEANPLPQLSFFKKTRFDNRL